MNFFRHQLDFFRVTNEEFWHSGTKKMMAKINKYMASLEIDIGNSDFEEFDGTEFTFYHGSYN